MTLPNQKRRMALEVDDHDFQAEIDAIGKRIDEIMKKVEKVCSPEKAAEQGQGSLSQDRP